METVALFYNEQSMDKSLEVRNYKFFTSQSNAACNLYLDLFIFHLINIDSLPIHSYTFVVAYVISLQISHNRTNQLPN